MSCKISLLIAQLLVILLINESRCFNLDVNNYIRHEGQDGSMFGFSVALHQEQQRSWVIVGAPKADTSQYQQDVHKGGAVYRCDISDDNRCQIIHFDSNGNNFNERNEQIDTKSNQWFGATVSSAGIDGPLVACAPRYVYHQHQPKKVERIEPVGTCFIAKDNFKEYQEYSPCRTMYWGYHRQGSCQAGLSAAVNKAGDRLFVGAPGSWYWQGQMYSYGLNNPKDKVYSTKESSSKEDDSYLGYSSIAGDFTGDGQQGVAVGMPRGGGLLGKVLVFSWNLTNQVNITGEQIGAYFGYSLCTVDVDGDKLDDLIIGAPMYTEPNNEGKYENGRVYIVYQGKFNKFKELETREGTASKGRFGLSLASLGDINLDGYGDFAVGAPYDGPNGNGAVYVYHGSKNGPLAKHSQVIFAEDVVGTEHLSTFGFSLSGGIDLDGNQYPDMVVGAYDSNRAIVFKSRAVAVMEASTSFQADNKLVSLENKNCTVGRDSKQVTCTTVVSCLKYNGINLPTSIDIEISWILDSKKPKQPRMYFIQDEGKNIRNSTMRLYRGKSECKTEAVYIADGIRDKLTPLEVEMKYNIRQATTAYTASTVSRRRRATLDPVLDENRGTVERDSINIMKNCGRDNICIPDLRLDVKTDEKYLLGANESLTVEVLISNFGEDAFEANFYMNIPQGLSYKSTKRIGENRDIFYVCTPPSVQTNNTLRCDIGNPLPAGKFVNFKVYMEPTKKGGRQGIEPFYDFYMEANSTNEEADGGRFDNILKKSVAIFVESDLSISGSSNPSEVHYNISLYKEFKNATLEAEIGPHVVHIYDIRNNGTSTIEEIEIYITWPAETLDEEPLMYLMNQPETLGPVVCDIAPAVNKAQLYRDHILERKSFLDKNRSPVRQGDTGYYTTRYNTQGGATQEEKNILDRDESRESSGDASIIHTQRGKDAGHYEGWQGGRGVTTSTANRQGGSSQRNSFTETRHHAADSGDEKVEASRGFKWEKSEGRQGGSAARESSSTHRESSGSSQGSSSAGQANFDRSSQYDSRRGYQGASGGQANYDRSSQYDDRASSQGSTQGSSAGQANYDRSSQYDRSSSSGAATGGAGSSAREYEYEENWKSSSVNGGPVVTHHASKNRTITRGQDGRAVVSETSTERVYTGSVVNWDDQKRLDESSSRRVEQSSSQTEYERQQQEYYEAQRRHQEEQRIRQIEVRRRQQETQRREEEERYRLEEERVYQEEERRRLQHESTYNQANSGHDSSFNRQSESRVSGGSSSGSRSSSSGVSGGRSEVNFDSSVDQDISHLAARTHAEQSGSTGSSGRRRMQSQQDGESARPGLVTGVSALEKAAQGGRGFQTVGLDLGVLGSRNNVDEEMRRQSASSGGIAGTQSSSSSSHHSSSGHQTGGSSGHQSGGSSGHQSGGSSGHQSGSSSGYSYSSRDGYQQSSDKHNSKDEEYEDYEDGNEDGQEQQGGGGSTYSRTSSYSISHKRPLNAHHESIDQQFKHYPVKRDVSQISTEPICKSTNCASVRCVVGPLDKNSEALIALRTRLVAHTLVKLGGESEVKLSTMAFGRITKLPYIGKPLNDTLTSHEVVVTAIPNLVPKEDVIPLWIYVLAACAGTLILLLLVYLLYKCGFFKRNRPTGSPHERQPLNRNGNYHGDEHL